MDSSKVVIITGGSSGIGKSLAFEYGNHGYTVVITGRNAENLKSVENELIQNNIQAKGIKCDSANEEETKQMIQQVVSEFGGIDILINNAGISMRSMFESVQMDVMKQVMDINFWGTVYSTHAALPYIKERKGGIIGISSIAGYRGLPVRSGYSASKFAMNGFMEALRTELIGTGVHVLIACPGFTASNIRNASLNSEGKITGETMREESKMMSSEEVAKEIYKAFESKKKTLVLTFQGKLTVFLNKLFSGFIDKMVYNTLKKEKDSPLK
ncbi:SDR family oxidoreductase [Sandaracinomonas limnophila]|uniref:SDR family oxidoreductase n=1 Tax=Sandaracinomonas limnophila TaxID=1862386 RepID=A0A437PWF7_9BACT|nr:SDR family oxidoreductase [Sandaracinomonas limnophila]RVU26583.1 SDR family oxidoreductase [Sandaracinomonas limnophila]